MARLSDIEDADVYGAEDLRLGTVEHVLFHPSEPRAVALMVRPNPALLVVALPVAYVPWTDAASEDGALRFAGAKLPARRATEKALGLDMDTTVIWRGMPVEAPDGVRVGVIADAEIGLDGSLERLEVSTGGMGDIAYGRLEVPGDAVAGFSGNSVSLTVGADELVVSGGLARTAAQATEAAISTAAAVASATGDAVVGASYITGRAIRSAVGSKPLKRTKSALRGIADAFREGYEDTTPERKPPRAGRD